MNWLFTQSITGQSPADFAGGNSTYGSFSVKIHLFVFFASFKSNIWLNLSSFRLEMKRWSFFCPSRMKWLSLSFIKTIMKPFSPDFAWVCVMSSPIQLKVLDVIWRSKRVHTRVRRFKSDLQSLVLFSIYSDLKLFLTCRNGVINAFCSRVCVCVCLSSDAFLDYHLI